MLDPALVLDPGEPSHVPALERWLAFQRKHALSPRSAVEALRRSGGDPNRARVRARPQPMSDAAPVPVALKLLARAGAVLVPWVSAAYPWRLAQLADPAPVLSVVGDVSALAAPAVAIVGARAATSYGRKVARGLAADLARAGLVVVSGLAHGIDAEAHRGALEAGGRTIAVQACGPDLVYPSAHRRLAARIALCGAIVSEFPPGTRPRRAWFPLRNRLISGLSRGLVVVEARERSGSLVTVRHALDQGIDVFAVPGPIDVPTSAGPNRLLREGAWPVLSAADVLDVLCFASGPAAPVRLPPISPASRAVLLVLERRPASSDELGRELSRPPEAISLSLLDLELEGRIVQDRDGRFRAVP